MSKLIVTTFTEQGVPKTGLTPTLRIRDLSDNSLIITDGEMSEVGDGFYKYTFTTYDPFKNYSIRCYGGASLPIFERYKYGVNNFVSLEEMSIELEDTDASIG
jgi:hypothetical protein